MVQTEYLVVSGYTVAWHASDVRLDHCYHHREIEAAICMNVPFLEATSKIYVKCEKCPNEVEVKVPRLGETVLCNNCKERNDTRDRRDSEAGVTQVPHVTEPHNIKADT